MKNEDREETEAFHIKVFRGLKYFKYRYKRLKCRANYHSFLITLCTIFIIPFLNNLPSEITIFNNVTQIVNINSSVDNE